MLLAAMLPGAWAAGQETGLVLTREAAFVSASEIRVELTITGDSGTTGSLLALGLEETFPPAWSYNGNYEEYYGETSPKAVGDKGVSIGAHGPGRLELYWIQVPEFPVRIVYGVNVSSFEGGQSISGKIYWLTDVAEFEADSPVTVVEPFGSEGEGEAVVEGEGESAVEGEGEVVAEGEGEAVVEGEGEAETGSLTGVVRNADTELPVSGVLVTLVPGDYQDTTNFIGGFSFSSLPVGTYTLTATKTGYSSFSKEVIIEAGINALDVKITPGGDEGEGEIVEGEGETPAEGEGEAVVEGEGETPVEGELERGALSGTVTNGETGLPLFEALVTIAPGNYEQRTDRQGKYRISGMPLGNYALVASLSGFANYSSAVTINAGENVLDFVMAPVPAEGEIESEGEGENEGEVEGEVPADDCGACCTASKDFPKNWRNYLGDLFLLAVAVLLVSRFNYIK